LEVTRGGKSGWESQMFSIRKMVLLGAFVEASRRRGCDQKWGKRRR
jgi:hypothetical protein